MNTRPDYSRKIRLLDKSYKEKYANIYNQLKHNLSDIKKDPPPMKRSRVWKKFFMKVFTTIMLPTVALFVILAFAFGLSAALIYFGMNEKIATLVGPGIAIGVPFLFSMMRRLYKDSVDEVATENKKLMKDLKGNY